MRLPHTIRRASTASVFLLALLAQVRIGRAAPQQAAAPVHRAGSTSEPSEPAAQLAPLALPDRDFPPAYVGLPFHASVAPAGGSGAYSLALYNPLPPGLTFQTGPTTLAVGGVPSTPGLYRFQIVVTDLGGATLSHDYSIDVKPENLRPESRGNIVLNDTEGFTFTDTDKQFFPIKISDTESFSFSDAEKQARGDLLADPETFVLTDTIALSLQIGVTPTSTPAGKEGVPYSQTFTPVGYVSPPALTASGTLPTGLSFVAGSNSVTVSGTPTQSGTFPFTITAQDSSTKNTVSYSLVIEPATPILSITPSSLTFPSTTVGASAASQVVTIKNTGTTAVSFTASTTITGAGAASFTKSASTCINPLAAGASCTNTITFTPQTTGTLIATVTYTDTAAGSPQTVSLSGTGAAASTGLTITPSSLTFPSTAVGASAATQIITLKNTTAAAVSFTASTTITGSGASSFTKSASTCTNPLAAGASCTNTITFTPHTTGPLTATITYTDSAASAPQTAALSGTGASAFTGLTITPSSLTFPSTAINTSAATQTITLKNPTSSAVSFTASTTITGSGASSFTKSASTCTNPLPAGASCANTITFTPQTTGPLTATITYTDSASTTPQTIALSGTGVSPALDINPSSLAFPSTAVGASAATQVITLKNTTSSAITFTASTTITGTDASSFTKSASTCTNPLAAGTSCTNTITFTPKATGALSATITYTDAATGSPQTVALSGTGH